MTKGGWTREVATFVPGDKPKIEWGGGSMPKLEFVLDPENEVLKGWWWSGGSFTATGRKIR